MNCKYCNKEISLTPTQKERGSVGKKQCNSCSVSKRRWKSKLELVKLLGGKCSRCGWNEHPAGLQFHHLDPNQKDFSISSNKLLLKSRKEEVLKCKLLCACCHSIEHTNTDLLKKMHLI
jgi:hypothetical protein